jgi:hypothetical protein
LVYRREGEQYRVVGKGISANKKDLLVLFCVRDERDDDDDDDVLRVIPSHTFAPPERLFHKRVRRKLRVRALTQKRRLTHIYPSRKLLEIAKVVCWF